MVPCDTALSGAGIRDAGPIGAEWLNDEPPAERLRLSRFPADQRLRRAAVVLEGVSGLLALPTLASLWLRQLVPAIDLEWSPAPPIVDPTAGRSRSPSSGGLAWNAAFEFHALVPGRSRSERVRCSLGEGQGPVRVCIYPFSLCCRSRWRRPGPDKTPGIPGLPIRRHKELRSSRRR